ALTCLIFCVSYIFVIQPAIFYIFGFQQPGISQSVNHQKPKLQSESGSFQRYATATKKEKKHSGIVATILPFYACGIFLYFLYTIIKLIGNRKKVSETKKESYLKDYYRNFRYVPKKGKFLMDSDSSSEESGGNDRKVRKKYNFGWSPIPNGSIESPDIYRSVASLPKDLEYLLKKADEDKLG
uniref:RIC3 domain-containing protein n=1 Tax=Mesocestoides corti TaxID=53468 RepID=A0A5K3EL05_MESCO